MPHPAALAPKRRAARRLCLAVVPILGLSACAGVPPIEGLRVAAVTQGRYLAAFFAPPGPETRALANPPGPVAKPARPLMRPVSARDPRDGSAVTLVPRALRGGAVEVRDQDGCVWRRSDWFAPSTRWRGCGDSAAWRDGSATVSGGQGLWPLRPGAEGRFLRRAVSATGRSYSRDTRCRVEDAVAVLRDGRDPTPAFVVACTDGKRVRTTWWAPGEGPVAFRQTHSEKGVEAVWVAD